MIVCTGRAPVINITDALDRTASLGRITDGHEFIQHSALGLEEGMAQDNRRDGALNGQCL